jgi:hypothetical protein
LEFKLDSSPPQIPVAFEAPLKQLLRRLEEGCKGFDFYRGDTLGVRIGFSQDKERRLADFGLPMIVAYRIHNSNRTVVGPFLAFFYRDGDNAYAVLPAASDVIREEFRSGDPDMVIEEAASQILFKLQNMAEAVPA